ncbi:hypothetical protein ACWDAZ_40580, partial [Streptomyces sp. NPDC001215]
RLGRRIRESGHVIRPDEERVLLSASGRNPETFAAAADAELAAAKPLPHNGYKVMLMRNLVVAVLTELAEEADR